MFWFASIICSKVSLDYQAKITKLNLHSHEFFLAVPGLVILRLGEYRTNNQRGEFIEFIR